MVEKDKKQEKVMVEVGCGNCGGKVRIDPKKLTSTTANFVELPQCYCPKCNAKCETEVVRV